MLAHVQFWDSPRNGEHVASGNVSSDDLPSDGAANSAREDLEFDEIQLSNPSAYLVEGTNVLAIHLVNASLGGSSDAFLDVRLASSASAGSGPTPGALNSATTSNAPPQLRQVRHDLRKANRMHSNRIDLDTGAPS